MAQGLKFGGLGESAAHLCIDMQRLFGEEGPWPTPWTGRILPRVRAIAERFPERTIFTRFIPPHRPEDMAGMWRRYYRRWRHVTRERLDPALLDLLPPLAALAPPAAVVDKHTYSAFSRPELPELLRQRRVDALIVSGAETDVCVLATVLGAVERGYRVVVAGDAVCSSSDLGHDRLIEVYRNRYSEQIEIADVEEILSGWR